MLHPIDAAACEVGNEIRAVFRDEVFATAEERVFERWLPEAEERLTAYVDVVMPMVVDAAVERAKVRIREALPELLSEAVQKTRIPTSAKVAIGLSAVAVFASAAFSFATWRRGRCP